MFDYVMTLSSQWMCPNRIFLKLAIFIPIILPFSRYFAMEITYFKLLPNKKLLKLYYPYMQQSLAAYSSLYFLPLPQTMEKWAQNGKTQRKWNKKQTNNESNETSKRKKRNNRQEYLKCKKEIFSLLKLWIESREEQRAKKIYSCSKFNKVHKSVRFLVFISRFFLVDIIWMHFVFLFRNLPVKIPQFFLIEWMTRRNNNHKIEYVQCIFGPGQRMKKKNNNKGNGKKGRQKRRSK